ncbi:MAG TPA: VWA domain-containing protein [Kofleriaceae bacterium]
MTPRTRLAWVLLFAAACAAPKTAKLADNRTTPLVVNVDPKLVEMTVEATTALLDADDHNELGLRVRITGKALPDAQRPALNLGLVLDTSGSMEGDAIASLRDSAKGLVAKLRDGDRLSIVAFHSHADVLVQNDVITSATRARALKKIDGIAARGTTDLASGLAFGLAQVTAARLPAGINRIVLLSDGVPNNQTNLPATLASIQQNGISVTSLGLGIDYDTTLMTRIARDTGGAFHYIEKPDAVAAVFDEELTKMTTVVGRGLNLVIEPGPNVKFHALPGFTLAPDGKLYAVVGDLAAGETRDLMFPLAIAARGEGSTAEIALATLTFDDVIGKTGQQKRDGFVALKTSNDAAAIKAAVKIGLEAARVRATAAGATLEAIALARSGQIEQARKRVADAITAVKAAIKKLGDPELETIVTELDALSKDLAKIVPPPQVIGTGMPHGTGMQLDHAPAPAMAPPMVEPTLRRAEERAGETVRGSKNRRR